MKDHLNILTYFKKRIKIYPNHKTRETFPLPHNLALAKSLFILG